MLPYLIASLLAFLLHAHHCIADVAQCNIDADCPAGHPCVSADDLFTYDFGKFKRLPSGFAPKKDCNLILQRNPAVSDFCNVNEAS
jgi:hypothetical protein